MEGEAPWASLCVCVGMGLEVGPGRPGWPLRAFLGIWEVGVKCGVIKLRCRFCGPRGGKTLTEPFVSSSVLGLHCISLKTC